MIKYYVRFAEPIKSYKFYAFEKENDFKEFILRWEKDDRLINVSIECDEHIEADESIGIGYYSWLWQHSKNINTLTVKYINYNKI